MIAYPFGVGRVTTRIIEAGNPGATPVILVHGLTSRADRWRGTVSALSAAGYRVLAPDLPGHGFASKNPADDHTIPGYRDFIVGLLDAMGIERAILIGTSMGGHVVGAVACMAPQRVEALVMVGSLGFEAFTPERAAIVRKAYSDWSLEAVRARLLTVFNDPALVTDQLAREDRLVNISPGARECLNRFLDYRETAFNNDLLIDRMAGVAELLPVLFIWGADDRSVPLAIGRLARSKTAKARLAIFARTNHTPYMERPDLFNEVVLRFLSRTLDGPIDELMSYC